MLELVLILVSAVLVSAVSKIALVAHLRAHRPRKAAAPLEVPTPIDNPWGTHEELIAWAEQRAVNEFRANDPVTEAIRARFLAAMKTGQPYAILEESTFWTINDQRARAGYLNIEDAAAADYIQMPAGDYGRYLDGIGYVTADSPELLNRACESVMRRRGYDHLRTLLMGAYHGVDPEVRQRSQWVMDLESFISLRDVLDPGGHPIWAPSMVINGPQYILGLPVDVRIGGGKPHLEPLDSPTQEELDQRFAYHEYILRRMDKRIAAMAGVPGPQVQALRDARNTEWEKAKTTVELVQALYDRVARQ